ncbi:MAG: hypothetical protein KIT84_33555 [Labilithrix sp.]|nr:hypothetical protein [Labilithrix sp.]MCW5815974.1 hypothetical protein [Labilithrix sp.]
MQVDRGGYLVFVSSIALGGALGYIASEKDLVPHLKKPEAPPPPPPPPPAVSVSAPPPPPPVVDAGPSCDDSIGEPDSCPPIGLPTVEGGCGPLAFNRCNDFKKLMKPKVAQAAVACLKKLNYAEQCDPKRIDLCAHQALMNACDDPAGTAVTTCDAIAKSCPSSSASECRLAVSGLREVGREALADCTKKRCADKGIVGCAAAPADLLR